MSLTWIPLGLRKRLVSAASHCMVLSPLTLLPGQHRKIARGCGPLDRVLHLLQVLQLHRQNPLLNLVIGKDAQVAGASEDVAERDEPLGRIVLVPIEGIPVIHRKLMVEVVVAFAHGEQRR